MQSGFFAVMLAAGLLPAFLSDVAAEGKPSVVPAIPLTTTRTAEGRILLEEAQPCRHIKSAIVALGGWQEAFQEKPATRHSVYVPSISVETVKKTAGGWTATPKGCTADITDILPPKIRERAGLYPDSNGPNCFNTSLLLSELLPYSSYTEDTEIDFWLHSPYCRALGEGEAKLPGDVLVIRNGFEIVHAYTHLWNDMAFSKNGFRRESEFKFVATQELQDGFAYRVEKDFRDVRVNAQGIPLKTPKSRNDQYQLTYRCRPPQIQLDSQQKQTMRRLNQIGQCIEKKTLYGWAIEETGPALEEIQAIAKREVEKIEKTLQRKGLQADVVQKQRESLSFWQSIQLRAASLAL